MNNDNIKAIPFANNHKFVGGFHVEPNSVLKEIAEKTYQLSQGLITVTDLVLCCKEYWWIVQSFSSTEIRLTTTKPTVLVTKYGNTLEVSESVYITFGVDGVITDLKAETFFFEIN